MWCSPESLTSFLPETISKKAYYTGPYFTLNFLFICHIIYLFICVTKPRTLHPPPTHTHTRTPLKCSCFMQNYTNSTSTYWISNSVFSWLSAYGKHKWIDFSNQVLSSHYLPDQLFPELISFHSWQYSLRMALLAKRLFAAVSIAVGPHTLTAAIMEPSVPRRAGNFTGLLATSHSHTGFKIHHCTNGRYIHRRWGR